MTSSFQDTVLDFDLNFLQQPSINAEIESKLEKQKKAILIAKKKTIATDSLIRKYYEKKEQLDQTEIRLLASKEECKQICIDYKNSVEKCTQLEKDVQLLQSRYSEMEQNYIMSQNQVEAMKSHARQLQDLVKENETTIESMKIDNGLEKSNIKDIEKKFASLQKEHDQVLKQLSLACVIALGKKKLQNHHKNILQKYVSTNDDQDEDDDDSLSESSEGTDFFEASPDSPLYTVIEICPEVDETKEADINNDEKESIKQDVRRMLEDHESDYSNGVVSEDTGRGSSLAFSDSEKCVNSPDYFATNSPAVETNPKNSKTFADASTSTRKNPEMIHRATSPIAFDDDIETDHTLSQIVVQDENLITDLNLSDTANIKEKPKLIDIATSPVRDLGKITIATSPVRDLGKITIATSPVIFMDTSDITTCTSDSNKDNGTNIVHNEDSERNETRNHIVFNDLSNNCELEISGKSRKEKSCFENQSSIDTQEEINNDNEVEMILNTMKLRHKLITPLPQTPVRLSKKIRKHLEPVYEKPNVEIQKHSCPDAIELREENKLLKSSIADLTKDILNIKFILKKQLLMPESPKKSPTTTNIESSNTKLHDNTSQQSIITVNDSDENITVVSNEIQNCDVTVDICPMEVSNDKTLVRDSEKHIDFDDELSPGVISSHETDFVPILPQDISIEAPQRTSYIQADSQNINSEDVTENNSVPETRCEELTTSENVFEIIDNPVSKCESDMLDINRHDKQNVGRQKKLSRLDKLRRRLIPKSKIKFKPPPTRKRKHCKIIPISKLNQSETVLNNKVAFEKAIKVMKELNLKQLTPNKDMSSINKNVEINKTPEKINAVTKENKNDGDVKSLCKDKIDAKQFVVCLPRLNLEKQMQNIKKCGIQHVENTLGSVNSSPEKYTDDIDTASPKSVRTTRSRSKLGDQSYDENILSLKSPRKVTEEVAEEIIKTHDRSEKVRRRLKRVASDSSDVSCKRVLRSSLRDSRNSIEDNNVSLAELASPRRTNNTSKIKSPINRSSLRNSRNSAEDNNVNLAEITSPRRTNNTSKIKSPINTNSLRDSRNSREDNNISLAELASPRRTYSTSKIKSPLNRSSLGDSRNSVEDNNVNLAEVTSPRRSNDTSKIKSALNRSSEENKTDKCNINASNPIVESNNNNIVDVTYDSRVSDPRKSILCKMIEKYGRGSVKFAPKKISENITNQIYKKLETDIANIIKLPADESKAAANKLVEELQELKTKHFMSGFMKYLKDPLRKQELFSKVTLAPAPCMTKSEQILLYILKEMEVTTPDFVNLVLTHIEFSLFHLNKTPEFDVIESLSHFYALTCRYFRLKTRLRLFLLDAMYCLQFKVVPLVKQCLEVWMHILPLAHMGIAKSPLVTCLVYLLHFYKCEDRFNRIQDIRMILNKKYFYKMTDWNEPKILEMFRNCLTELREIPLEKKMLRLAFIILAKRQGPTWCQKNIIKNMLTPLIEQENVPLRTKKFCVSLLGPLLKPYPKDMKVHCEIVVNQLLDKLENNPQDDMKEAIFTSLIYMNKHNQNRVTRALLSWSPKKPSEEFEQLMCDFVREKPVRVWKGILSKITL
ncbi:unnamed protein product [Danaus chrysippus]|uniref:(African queen) hypothetical protein n=1 Tax=Danaus chrysippus TaxID=151541 RepID=A0A8J2QUT1_9NEOP|nr:unnamed protein product [Danaus chrysippus]